MTIERAVLGRLRNEAQTMDKCSLSANVVERHCAQTEHDSAQPFYNAYSRHIYIVKNEAVSYNIHAFFCLLRLSSLLSFVWAF